jgi:hypothetical protein
MEQTRRVAVDSLVPSVPLAAYPRTGSSCACCCAYSLHAINSFLLPPGTPRADSSVTHPSHDQLCSTSIHSRRWQPAGHTAASPSRLHTSLTGAPFCSTAIFTSALPQSQPSSRFPSYLLSAYHPLHPLIPETTQFVPIIFKVLLLCFPFSSRTDFVVSQLPLLQCNVQASWPHFVLLLSIAFNTLAVSGLGVLSCFLPERFPLSYPHELPLLTCGRLATCHPPDASPPDQSDISILSVAPATCDARTCRRHFLPCRLPHHI